MHSITVMIYRYFGIGRDGEREKRERERGGVKGRGVC